MSYPAAYCVKCRTHTDTRNKETIILSNKARALKGYCPVCYSENYKFMPAKTFSGQPLGQEKTAVKTLLPTTAVARQFGYSMDWQKWMIYAFFVMSCVTFGYVLSIRF